MSVEKMSSLLANISLWMSVCVCVRGKKEKVPTELKACPIRLRLQGNQKG